MPKPVATIPEDVRRILSPRQVKKILAMDSQRRYQAIRLARGLCVLCGKEPLAGKRYGESCLTKARERMRRKIGVEKPRGAQLKRLRTLRAD